MVDGGGRLGKVFRTAYDVHRIAVCAVRAESAGISQRLEQRQAGGAERNHLRVTDLAQHVDLVSRVAVEVQVVAILQEDPAQLRVPAIQRVDVDQVILALPAQSQPGQVGIGQVDAGDTHRLHQAQRNIGNRLRAGDLEGTGQQYSLAVVAQHFDVDLDLGVLRRQAHAQLLTNLADRFATRADFAYIGEVERAVVEHFPGVGIQLVL